MDSKKNDDVIEEAEDAILESEAQMEIGTTMDTKTTSNNDIEPILHKMEKVFNVSSHENLQGTITISDESGDSCDTLKRDASDNNAGGTSLCNIDEVPTVCCKSDVPVINEPDDGGASLANEDEAHIDYPTTDIDDSYNSNSSKSLFSTCPEKINTSETNEKTWKQELKELDDHMTSMEKSSQSFMDSIDDDMDLENLDLTPPQSVILIEDDDLNKSTTTIKSTTPITDEEDEHGEINYISGTPDNTNANTNINPLKGINPYDTLLKIVNFQVKHPKNSDVIIIQRQIL